MSLAEELRASLAQPPRLRARMFPGDDGLDLNGLSLVGAAVLVPVVDRAEPGLLLTLRNAAMRRHAGQVAFPGGRIDPEDEGPIHAALREAEEEIGLPRVQVDVVGMLDPYLTGTGYHVTPVLSVVPPDLPLAPHEAEVAAVFEVPLSFLRDPANWAMRTLEHKGRRRRYYEIYWGDHRIWGATASMIVNIGRRLAVV